jgi:hypothetical protein
MFFGCAKLLSITRRVTLATFQLNAPGCGHEWALVTLDHELRG